MSDLRAETENCLKDACDNQIDIGEVVGKILESAFGEQKDNEVSKKGKNTETLSVSQRCEWWENEHVVKLMSLYEKNWIKASRQTILPTSRGYGHYLSNDRIGTFLQLNEGWRREKDYIYT